MAGPPTALFHGALLLAWRKWLVEFAIHEEIAQDPTGTPGDAVRPSFDSRGILFINEDAAAAHQMAPFPVMGPTWNMMQYSGQTCFEENQGIVGGSHVAGERWLQDCRCVVDHCSGEKGAIEPDRCKKDK